MSFAWGLYRDYFFSSNPTGKLNEHFHKQSMRDYLTSFASLIASVQKEGLRTKHGNPITVSDKGVVIDGAHRLAAAYLLDYETASVRVVESEDMIGAQILNFAKKNGFSGHYLEAIQLKILQSSENLGALVFFGLPHDYNLDLLSKDVASKKALAAFPLKLTDEGVFRLVELCYGTKDFFTDDIQRRMALERFLDSKANCATLIFLDMDSESLRELKERLRRDIQGFERKLHSTDSKADAVRLLTFASATGCHWANYSTLSPDQERDFRKRIQPLHKEDNPCADQFFLLGTKGIEAYGFPECVGDQVPEAVAVTPNTMTEKSAKLTGELSRLRFDFGDLNMDPSKYFYFEGYKLLSLEGTIVRFTTSTFSECCLDAVSFAASLLRGNPVRLPERKLPSKHSLGAYRIRASRLYEYTMSVLPKGISVKIRSIVNEIRRKLAG